MSSCFTSCTTDLVDISGLCDPQDVRSVISAYPYWIQMNIPEKLTIPDQKPNIEQINSVNVSTNILRKEVIKVPESPNGASNLEGKVSTGRKIIIEGEICQKVVYTAEEPEQSIHSAHFYVPFSSYIVVPKTITFTNGTVSTTLDTLDVDFQINTCIEDVAIRMLDSRTILKQITLLLYAVPNQSL